VLDFIQSHKVVLITISIGGDDVQHCISAAGVIDDTCLEKARPRLRPSDVAALRLAVGSSVPIVGSDFFLAAWVLLPPPDGRCWRRSRWTSLQASTSARHLHRAARKRPMWRALSHRELVERA
jgi:hypothetical protein